MRSSINNMVKTRRHSNDMILSIDVSKRVFFTRLQNLTRHPFFLGNVKETIKKIKKQIAHIRMRRTEHQLDRYKV